jgi:hypothetical protein
MALVPVTCESKKFNRRLWSRFRSRLVVRGVLLFAMALGFAACDPDGRFYEPPPSGYVAVVIAVKKASHWPREVDELIRAFEDLPGHAPGQPLITVRKQGRLFDRFLIRLIRDANYQPVSSDRRLEDSVGAIIARQGELKRNITMTTVSGP